MEGSKKLFYSMGEVAEMFDVKPSLIRFWEGEFDIIKPKRNKKGNRMFTPADVDNLKLIYHLVKERGMTLDGARKALKQNRNDLARDVQLFERLQSIRSLLVDVRNELKSGIESDLPADDVVDMVESVVADQEPSAESQEQSQAKKQPVEVIEPRRQRAPRRKREEEAQNKELFAFYEQSLF